MMTILLAIFSIFASRFAAVPRSSSDLSLLSISWRFCADSALVDLSFHPWIGCCGWCSTPLPEGHRRDGVGQARNRGRMASPGLPGLLALAIMSTGTAKDQLSLSQT